MTREEFIKTYTNDFNSLIIGIKTLQSLDYLLYLLERLKIDPPSSSIMDNLRIGLDVNKGVGLLLKISYSGMFHWSYTSNAYTIVDYQVKWFDGVHTNVLEGDEL